MTTSILSSPARQGAAAELPPLARRLAWQLAALGAALTALLLAGSAWIGHQAMQREHEAAGLRMAALFEAGLRNAMLKRDLDGLRHILTGLDGVPGVASAALLAPSGEVRFSSGARVPVGQDDSALLRPLCLSAGCGAIAQARTTWAEDGTMRVLYPVHNAQPCAICHGPVAGHPVNGVLLLDFAALASERTARLRAGTELLPAALAALALMTLGAAWLLRRDVLAPLGRVLEAVHAFGAGRPGARTRLEALPGAPTREMQQLALGFDGMAERVEDQVAALQRQRTFLQSLLDAAPDAMVVIGADHRIVMANQAYARLTGQPPGAVVDSPCHRTSRGRAEPCPSTLVSCPLVDCREGSATRRQVMGFVHADGHAIDVEIDAAPLVGPDGSWQVIEVIRRLDEQVRFSQEQRLSAIGLLANGVAHEVHNPLASIRLALQSSLRELDEGRLDADELRDWLKLVDAQIDRCVLTTQRLMRLSQPPAALAQPVDVGAALKDVLGLVGEELRRARVEARLDLAAGTTRVLMDESEIRQVLLNLVQNAIHAMPAGGVLTLEVRRLAGRVTLAVIDQGCGIAPELRPLIFLPFFSRRVDGQRGTGLGLPICKGMVEARGGSLTVASSQVGEGSRFEVVLPDADAPAQAGEDGAAAAVSRPLPGDSGERPVTLHHGGLP